MNVIEKDIYVTQNHNNFERISYVQATNEIPIVLHIRDYSIPSSSTARVYVKRPDGTAEYDTAVLNGNDVTINVKDTMFSVVGKSKMQVRIAKGDKKLVSFAIDVYVEKNYTDGGIKSQNAMDIFDEELKKLAKAPEEAIAAATKSAADSQKSADDSEKYAKLAESHAHGKTGVRAGEATDNSEYYSGLAKDEADRAKDEADRAAAIARYDIDSELSETSSNPVMNKVVKAAIDNSWSLSGGTRLSEGEDLNDFFDIGNYYCTTNAIAASLLNCPTGGYSFIMKIYYGTGAYFLKQRIIVRGDYREYAREYNNGAWSKWREIIAGGPISFTKSTTRNNLANNDTIAAAFGKMAKWYDDFNAELEEIRAILKANSLT